MGNLLLCKDTTVEDLGTTNNLNVVLSPDFYWFRNFDIPTNKNSEILSSLPLLFSEIVSNNYPIEYCYSKNNSGSYDCYAFNKNLIIEKLSNLGIKKNNIKSITFLENQTNEKIFSLQNRVFMKNDDKPYFKVPKQLLKNQEVIKIDFSDLSKSGLNIFKLVFTKTKTNNFKFKLFIIANLFMVSGLLLSIYSLIDYNEKLNYKLNETLKKYNISKSIKKNNINLENLKEKDVKFNLYSKKQNEVFDIISSNNLKVKSFKFEDNLFVLELYTGNVEFLNDKFKSKFVSSKFNNKTIEVTLW